MAARKRHSAEDIVRKLLQVVEVTPASLTAGDVEAALGAPDER
jgi:hypothetical protein